MCGIIEKVSVRAAVSLSKKTSLIKECLSQVKPGEKGPGSARKSLQAELPTLAGPEQGKQIKQKLSLSLYNFHLKKASM